MSYSKFGLSSELAKRNANQPDWLDGEVKILKKYAGKKTSKQIAELLVLRTANAVEKKARQLKISLKVIRVKPEQFEKTPINKEVIRKDTQVRTRLRMKDPSKPSEAVRQYRENTTAVHKLALNGVWQ